MIRILIADDHAILRRGLKEILMRELDSVTWGEAENGEQVLDQIQSHDWDLLILDITMPGRGGLDVLKNLKALRPRLPVLVLSMHPEDQYGKRVLKAGASGYMNKESAPEELMKAVRKLLGGGRYVSPALAETLASIGTALAVMEEGKIAMGQELNASYLRPISEGHVNGIARVRRKGRTAWNWEVELTDDQGRLCTLARLTIAVRDAGPDGPLRRGKTT